MDAIRKTRDAWKRFRTDPHPRRHLPGAAALPLVLLTLAAALAHGAIRFEAPLVGQIGGASSPDWPIQNAYADFNEDGFLDVASVAPGESLMVILGLGDGSFAAPLNVWAPGLMGQVAAGDFDGDGHADIGYGGSPSMVLFGDGTGAAWTHAPQVSTGFSHWTLSGDFDGDGGDDLLIIDRLSSPGATLALLGRAGRTFQTVTQVHDSLIGGCRDAAVADLNGDGRDDAVVLEYLGAIEFYVLISRGDGTFTFRGVKPEATDPRALAIGDVDEDGHPDVVMTRWFQVSVTPGIGDGTFGAVQTRWIQPHSGYGVALTDVNFDGHLDLLHTDTSTGVGIWLGHGDGAFDAPIIRPMGTILRGLYAADLNGDERPDLLASPFDGQSSDFAFAVALGRTDGHFGGGMIRLSLPLNPHPLLADDFDEDGFTDLAALSYPGGVTFCIVPGRSDRSFAPLPPITLPRPTRGVVRSGDLDLDGHLDLVLPADSSRTMLLFGRGDGTFEPAALVPAPGFAGTLYDPVACGDVTGDGLPDIVYGAGNAVRVLPGTGSRTFGSWVESPWTTTAVRIDFSDLNGDTNGDLLVVANDRWTRALGSGAGTFTFEPHRSLAFGESADGLSAMDANGDGRSDILHARTACPGCPLQPIEPLAIQLQQPDGSLAPPVIGTRPAAGLPTAMLAPEGLFPTSIVHSWYLGFGTLRETGPARFAIDTRYLSGHGFFPVAGDFDGDGRQDVATTAVVPGGSDPGIGYYFGRDADPPTLDVLAPASTSTHGAGSTIPVAWSSGDDAGPVTLDVFVSRHGPRGPWLPVMLGTPNTGAYEWVAAAPYSDSVSFKLVARDPAGNVSHGIAPGMVQVVDPVGVAPSPRTDPTRPEATIGPNPLRGRAVVHYSVPREGRVTIDVLDVQGRRVVRLLDALRSAGRHAIEWDAFQRSPALEPGVYVVRVATPAGNATARAVMTQR